MKLRWLWLDDIDPVFELSPEQRQTVQRLLTTYTREFRVGFNPLDLAHVFVPLAIGLIPVALMQFKIHTPNTFGGLWMLWLPFAALGWIAHAWIRSRYRRRLVNRALRSIGYDVCMGCGYWLRGLGDEQSRCPECGNTREPLSTEANPSHDSVAEEMRT